MPIVGTHDLFEQAYTADFKALVAPYGLFIHYENDRAALDLGLHLYDPAAVPGTLSQVRVWFQLKGIRASTRSAESLVGCESLPVDGLRADHIRYWFAQPDPMYLVVYVEALNRFLVADIRDLVEASGGIRWLRKLEEDGQKTATLRLRLDRSLGDALQRMPLHRSMRMDGPEFRGRQLGHRLDPLRSQLDVMRPALFEQLVRRLLSAHGFVPEREIDPRLFADIGTVDGAVGRMHSRYEWTCPLFTAFGYDEAGGGFREESEPLHAQGELLVVIHSDAAGVPRQSEELSQVLSDIYNSGVEEALVFFNASEGESRLIGGWRVGALRPLAVQFPQGLGSLAYNVLTATNVYMEFADQLPWRIINIQ